MTREQICVKDLNFWKCLLAVCQVYVSIYFLICTKIWIFRLLDYKGKQQMFIICWTISITPSVSSLPPHTLHILPFIKNYSTCWIGCLSTHVLSSSWPITHHWQHIRSPRKQAPWTPRIFTSIQLQIPSDHHSKLASVITQNSWCLWNPNPKAAGNNWETIMQTSLRWVCLLTHGGPVLTESAVTILSYPKKFPFTPERFFHNLL